MEENILMKVEFKNVGESLVALQYRSPKIEMENELKLLHTLYCDNPEKALKEYIRILQDFANSVIKEHQRCMS